jgi:hypothetical protein
MINARTRERLIIMHHVTGHQLETRMRTVQDTVPDMDMDMEIMDMEATRDPRVLRCPS